MSRIDEALVDSIHSAIAGWVKGTNAFMGPVRKVGQGIPEEALFVHAQGGPAPQVYADGGAGTNLEEPSIQIIYRSDTTAGAFAAGQIKVDALYAAVRKAVPAGSIGVLAEQSKSLYLGQDDQGHCLWSINLRGWQRT